MEVILGVGEVTFAVLGLAHLSEDEEALLPTGKEAILLLPKQPSSHGARQHTIIILQLLREVNGGGRARHLLVVTPSLAAGVDNPLPPFPAHLPLALLLSASSHHLLISPPLWPSSRIWRMLNVME